MVPHPWLLWWVHQGAEIAQRANSLSQLLVLSQGIFLPYLPPKVMEMYLPKTSMGFVADDPNEPKDVGDASRRYHDSGKEKSFHLERTACCGPIFSVNEPVLRWLKDPDRRRYAMVF